MTVETMDLKQLQHQIRAGLFCEPTPQALLETVISTPSLNAKQRLHIYRDSILSNKINSLASIYNVCKRLVGEEFFAAMAENYCLQTKATDPDLNNYGASFADFIADFPPAAGLPYLSDVAKLEWAWHLAFNGPAAGQLDFSVLASLPEEDLAKLCIEIPENCSLLQSKYPIMKIWQVNQTDFDGDPVVSLDEGANFLIIWRKKFDVRIEQCHPTHWQCLKWLNNGLYLEQVLENCVELDPTIDVSALLPELASRGWLTAMTVKRITRRTPCG